MFFRESRRERQPGPPGPYWKQRGWQLSAGFLGIALVLGGAVALASDRDAPGDRGSAASEGPLTSGTVPKGARPEGCRTDDGAGETLPTAAPEDIDWRTLDVMRVPVSASAGPTRIQGALWWCFARTPVGAVLAAHIIPAQMSGPHWQTVTRQQVVPGEGRDMFEFKNSILRGPSPRPGQSSDVSYSGFSVTSYTRGSASVELLLKTGQGFATTTVDLRWSDGDWKVLPYRDGSLYSPLELAQGAGGHLLWRV